MSIIGYNYDVACLDRSDSNLYYFVLFNNYIRNKSDLIESTLILFRVSISFLSESINAHSNRILNI